MNDLELLKFAAKAAGLKFDFFCDGKSIYREQDNQPVYWNPLTDDGDALRLLVNRRLWLQDFAPRDCLEITTVAPDASRFGIIEIWQESDEDPICVHWYKAGEDRNAATRLAITRAAAEIGKAMP